MACLSIAETLSSSHVTKNQSRSQARGRKPHGHVPGEGDENEAASTRKAASEGEIEIANGTTERNGWWRGLGRRERYGKLFKNTSDPGGNANEKLLRDMEGSEDGVALLL